MIYIHGVLGLNPQFIVIIVTLGYPLVRNAIRDGLARLIEKHFSEVEIVSGTATAGIPHAAYLSEKWNYL